MFLICDVCFFIVGRGDERYLMDGRGSVYIVLPLHIFIVSLYIPLLQVLTIHQKLKNQILPTPI